MKFLVVEDDKNLAKIIKAVVEELGEVSVAYDGKQALEEVETNEFDLIILDLMLPEISGGTFLRRLRRTNSTPVIILTAVEDIEEKVKCFSDGADDYMTKPFSKEELVARVKAVLRRNSGSREGLSYSYKGMIVDYERKTVTFEGRRLAISGKKFDLLEYFVMNKNKVLAKQQIFNRVWGIYSETVYSVIDVYVSHLRKELDKIGLASQIKTISSTGYIWSEGDNEKK